MSSQFSGTIFLDKMQEQKVQALFEEFKTYFGENDALKDCDARERLELLLVDLDACIGKGMYVAEECREVLYMRHDMSYKTKLEELVHDDYHQMCVEANVHAMGPSETRLK